MIYFNSDQVLLFRYKRIRIITRVFLLYFIFLDTRKLLSGLKEQTMAIFDALRSVTILDISDNSVPHLSSMSGMSSLQRLTMNNVDSLGSVLGLTLSSLDTSALETWGARQLAMSSGELAKVSEALKGPKHPPSIP